MSSARVRLPATPHDWDGLRAELRIPGDFPPQVLEEAARTEPRGQHRDLTDVPFLTIDPPGSVDLDQAMALERRGPGYRVRYAIADVAAFVHPGGAVDGESHRRGVTYYAPDKRTPLHPVVLSEGRASLLEGEQRPALVWELDLDSAGRLEQTRLERALVRSRRQLDYEGVQRAIDTGDASPDLLLLKEIGQLREAQARARDAVDLPTPEQEVDAQGHLSFRAPLPVEGWNAQVSLLTGMAAAQVMLDARVGLLRTLPRPAQQDVDSLRRSALALGVPWPAGTSYGDVLSALDPHQPRAAAVLSLARRLLRGAAYTAFDGEVPAHPEHSAVAAPYAHCTAPLRRLADRYAGEVCLSALAGHAVPAWTREALVSLPAEMQEADRRAKALDRAVVDLAEACALQHRVGESFHGVVVEQGVVQLRDPAVRAPLEADGVAPGERVDVVLEAADVRTRQVRFRLA